MATIRKLKSGNYQVVIRLQGLNPIYRSFTTKKLATQFIRENEGNAKFLLASGKPIPVEITFNEIVDLYELDKPCRDPSRAGRLKYWCDLFGKLPILKITDDMIDNELHGLSITRAGATVNRYKSHLSAIFNYFNSLPEYKRIKHPNPVKTEFVSKFKGSRQMERFLSDAEQTKLLNTCKNSTWDRLYLLVLMALTTGGRKGELLGLRHSDIDYKTRRASLALTKNGKPRLLPLTQNVITVLLKFREVGTRLVFPSTKEKSKNPFDEKKAFKRALGDAGIEQCRFHDLRYPNLNKIQTFFKDT